MTISFETECWTLILAVTCLGDFEDPDDRWLICSDSFWLCWLWQGECKTTYPGSKVEGIVGEADLQWNDFLPRGLHISMYADDVAQWACSPEKTA